MHVAESLWTIDRATLSDVSEIARLMVELYRVEAPGMLPSDEAALVALLEIGLLEQGPEAIETSLVARDAGESSRLAGYIAMAPDFRPRRTLFCRRYFSAAARLLGPVTAARVLWRQFRMMALLCSPLVPGAAQLHSLIVDKSFQGQGLGERLVREVEELAIRQGQDSIVLYILAGNPVESFYRRLGYHRIPLPQSWFPRAHPGIAMQRALAGSAL